MYIVLLLVRIYGLVFDFYIIGRKIGVCVVTLCARLCQ